jgi:adenylate kinase
LSSALNLILLGPPAAGKGTQASRLHSALGFRDLHRYVLRANVKAGTKLGQAARSLWIRAVPDDLVVAMTAERLEQADIESGFILDGFPRTTEQTDAPRGKRTSKAAASAPRYS